MQLKQIIYITLAALLTACSDELTAPTYTVGEAVNAVTLRAGISEGGNSVQTRAVDGNHADHVPFKTSPATQLRLRVDGTWLGKGFSDDLVSKSTTATIGAVTVNGDKHNVVSFSNSEQLYWDDYGTADPANMPSVDGNGRDKGLTIYGVAVEGLATAPAVSDWKALAWTLDADQTGGFNAKDLLTSNNIRVSPGDGTYKFDDYVNDLKNSTSTSSNLLEFTHAMTLITVNLTAGEGFPGYESGAANAKFQAAPTVKLLDFNYTGTVNVETKVSTPTATTPNINAYRDNGTAWVSGGQHTSQFTALVFPGNQFSDNTDILKIEADGNVYYVNATKINAANQETNNTFEQGKNYIFSITVNKTGIDVTATIKEWDNVEAENVAPIINFSDCYGDTGTGFEKGFTLYRSTSVTGSYIDGLTEGNTSTVSYASAYTMLPQLYWPDHQTHYFFRGVWPQVGTAVGPATEKVKANAIDVTNVTYVPGKYPSDLMIGMPRKADGTTDEHCKSTHNVDGICATDASAGGAHDKEGLIHLNFRYVMSQVEVELKSVTGDAAVNIGADTKVELVNVYNTGDVNFNDGSVTTTGTTGSYTLNAVAGENLKRHSAIVPQNLTYSTAGAATNLRFKITVTNTDGTTDVYYADVNPIKEKDKSTKVAPNGKWESGTHYKYVLTLSKTAINVTATLTDWVEVTAEDNVWF